MFWNILFFCLLVVILVFEVINYTNINNESVIQAGERVQLSKEVAGSIQDEFQTWVKSTENLNKASIQSVSDNCVSVFKEILTH